MVFKSLQIGLHALFYMKRFLQYIPFFRGWHIQQLITPEAFCDRSKLFAVLKWSVNCLLETCYSLSEILIEKF